MNSESSSCWMLYSAFSTARLHKFASSWFPKKFLLKGSYFPTDQELLGQSLQCTNFAAGFLRALGQTRGRKCLLSYLSVNCRALQMQRKKNRNVQKRLILPGSIKSKKEEDHLQSYKKAENQKAASQSLWTRHVKRLKRQEKVISVWILWCF